VRTARLVARLAALSAWTSGCWLVLLAGFPFAGRGARRAAWRASRFQSWARTTSRIIGMRVAVGGERPEGPVLLVTNHLSYVDVVLLAAQMRCVFVSRADVADWPVLGVLSRSVGTLFIDRARRRDVVRVADEIRATLRAGQGVVFFPEGTSTQGAEVRAFRSSLLEPAAELGLPVRYASIRYETAGDDLPAHQAVSWWGGMTFGPHLLELLRLSGFDATIVFGDEPIRDSDRKSLARRLQRAVASGFVPMVS